jgi:hypothetical protein
MRLSHLAAVSGVALSAAAQPLVVPAANSTSPGTVPPADALTREFPRTHQQVIAAGLLSSIPIGASITQITFRASNFGTANALGNWPLSTLTFADFEVYLGRGARSPGSMSTVLAQNIVAGTEFRVRDGPLTIPAGAFANFVAPPGANPWGYALQVAPFVYTGGDLVLTIRHSGHLVPLTPRLFVDCLANPVPGLLQCMGASGMGATVGAPDQSLPVILRLRYTVPTPCPANCDASTVPPFLTANDFQCFIDAYTSAFTLSQPEQVSTYANCDGSTAFPVLNIGDFVCFNSRFAAGCS